jgi:WhiB family redox-sensing transcriptional regulator
MHARMLELLRDFIGDEPDWRADAACRDVDPALFFPDDKRWLDSRAAKAVCATCPVRADCLEAGIDERFGVWGGLTERERRIERRRRKTAAA